MRKNIRELLKETTREYLSNHTIRELYEKLLQLIITSWRILNLGINIALVEEFKKVKKIFLRNTVASIWERGKAVFLFINNYKRGELGNHLVNN